jgi:AcrR family transcriptional regulator
VGKTRALLHEALGSLILEKPYDSISVREILDRANVGRSTFYTHFRDKDELLADSINDMLRSIQPADAPSSGNWYERVFLFSLAVYEHHDRHRRTREARMGVRGRVILHAHLKKILAESIVADVKQHFKGHLSATRGMPPDLLGQYLASTCVLVLEWWIESRKPLRAGEVNNLFRALVLPTLSRMRV